MRRYTLQDYLAIFREDIPILVLSTLAIFLVVWSVTLSEWVEGLGVLFAIMLVALVINYLLTLTEFSDIFALTYTTFFSFFVVWSLISRLIEGNLTFRQRFIEAMIRTSLWARKAIEGGFSEDTLIFALVLGVLVWFTVFNAMWNLFRVRQIWYATIPAGLCLVINLFYYSGSAPLQLILFAFLALVFLLAVHTNTLNREVIWIREGIQYSPKTKSILFRTGGLMVGGLMLASFFAPTIPQSDRLVEFWEQDVDIWKRVEDNLERLFGGVGEQKTIYLRNYYGGSTLSMGGPVDLGDAPVFTVYAPDTYQYYWRSKVFDTYENGQWRTTGQVKLDSDFGNLIPESTETYLLRQPVQQRFLLKMAGTRLLYSAPQPIGFAGLPISYTVHYTTAGDAFGTTVLIQPQDLLVANDVYYATSSISIADENSLRQAGTEYPSWVTRSYLQLPFNITDRTLQLGQSIASGYDNPYDIARAVEAYLRQTIRYNENVDYPPEEVEPVDYVLFESQEGYCNYYASSMVVLLRSQGIPARVAAGFAQGNYNTLLNAYEVTESEAHTWVEVYFPRYGWIEFEPTASRAPILRAEAPAEPSDAVEESALEDQQPLPEETAPPAEENALPTVPSPFEEQAIVPPSFSLTIPPIVRWGFLFFFGTVGSLAAVYYRFEHEGMIGLSEISRTYARVMTYARFAGQHFRESDTPQERANRLLFEHPQSAEWVNRIMDIYMAEQYAPTRLRDAEHMKAVNRIRVAWTHLRNQLIRAGIENRIESVRSRLPWVS